MTLNTVGLGLIVLLLLFAFCVGVGIRILLVEQRKARRAGYGSLGDYLRAPPRSDQEKRDAVGLTLQGVVLCLVGIVVPPLFFLCLVGLFPLYIGARKVAYVSLGLGLVDDADPPIE